MTDRDFKESLELLDAELRLKARPLSERERGDVLWAAAFEALSWTLSHGNALQPHPYLWVHLAVAGYPEAVAKAGLRTAVAWGWLVAAKSSHGKAYRCPSNPETFAQFRATFPNMPAWAIGRLMKERIDNQIALDELQNPIAETAA